MLTTLRAVLALTLLAGFYGYALVVAAGFLALGLFVLTLTPTTSATASKGAGTLILVGLLLAGVLVLATWRAIRARPQWQGVPLPEHHAGELWTTVRQLADAVGTRPPDEIRLVAEANAAVAEHSRLLGLVGGRRHLHIGLPLLQAFTVSQLRAVLAHELGHYSHQHVRLAEPVYRGRMLIHHTLTQMARRSELTYLLLRPYAYLYLLVSAAVSRRQELEADRAAVRLAGRAAAASMLRDLPGLATLWHHYLEQYVTAGLRLTTLAPTNVLASFPAVLRARVDTLEQLRSQPASTERTRWDSHPSPAERIARIQQEPDVPGSDDNRPANALVPYLDLAVPELEAQFFGFEGRTRVPFAHYLPAVAEAAHQHDADRLYRGLARIAGPAFPDLATALDLLAAGRYPDLVAGLAPASADAATARQTVQQALAGAIAVAITGSGVGRWQPSWSTAPQLVGTAGVPIDYQGWAERAIDGKATAVRRELTGHGVDLSTTAVRSTVDIALAQAVAGLLDVRVDRQRHDVALFDLGLLLLPGLKSRRPPPARKRMLAALRDPATALADTPGARFIPYEEVASARLVRRVHLHREFQLYTGERFAIRIGTNAPPVGPGWQALDEAVKRLTPGTDDPTRR